MELCSKEQPTEHKNSVPPSQPLQIIKKHPQAIVPFKGSKQAAGFDLYSSETITIPPQHICIINTGIAAIFPPNTHSRVASCSGLAVQHSIQVGGDNLTTDSII